VNVADARSKHVFRTCCGAEVKIPIGTCWFASWREGKKTKTAKCGADHRLALAVERKHQVEVVENKHLDKAKECSVTLTALLARYSAAVGPGVKPDVFEDRRRCLERTIAELGASTMVDQVTEEMIEAWRAGKLKTMKPATVSMYLARIKGLLGWAVRQKIVTTRPTINTQAPDNGKLRYLTQDEARRLLDAARALPGGGEVAGDYIEVLLFTAMRKMEALNMEWSWVDLARKTINLPGEHSKNKRARVIPMTAEVVAVLERRRDQATTDCPHVFVLDGKHPGKGPIEWLFKKARIAAGLGKDVSIHVTRHSTTSWLVMAAVDPMTIMQVTGHRTFGMLQRYAHLSPSHLQAAVDKISMTAKPTPQPAPESASTPEESYVSVAPSNVIAFPVAKTGT
jgi:integrase